MKYDRLTRKVKLDIGGEEYSLLLTIGMLEELEDELPSGSTLVSMFLNRETPKIRIIRKAFCLGMEKNGVKIGQNQAEKLFEKYCEENGIQDAGSVYYVLLAASNILGTSVSNIILESAGMILKDTEVEVSEKNA